MVADDIHSLSALTVWAVDIVRQLCILYHADLLRTRVSAQNSFGRGVVLMPEARSPRQQHLFLHCATGNAEGEMQTRDACKVVSFHGLVKLPQSAGAQYIANLVQTVRFMTSPRRTLAVLVAIICRSLTEP